MIRVLVSAEPIDVAAEMDLLEVEGAGGIATFTGRVRADDGVTALTLEHYPEATNAALTALAQEATARWTLASATVAHRVGRMVPGDRVVFVGTASAHRASALEACAFLIDRLKTGAPFWKLEERGVASRWVDARAADEEAAARWHGQS